MEIIIEELSTLVGEGDILPAVPPLNERLQEALESAGLTQADIARVIGATPTTVHLLLSGITKKLRGDYALAIETATGYASQWLLSGKGPKKRGTNPPLIAVSNLVESATIPRVRFKLTAGTPGFQIEPVADQAGAMMFNADWFKEAGFNPDKLYAVTVSDGAMESLMFDGDTAIINTADALPVDGEVFALNYDGELLLRRMFRMSGQWSLASDNSDKQRFPDRPAHAGVFVIGRVVLRQSSRL